MRVVDLARQQVTVEELLRLARVEEVVIRDREGQEFVLEAADDFAREVARLGQSEQFIAFLAERAQEPGGTTLEEFEGALCGAGDDRAADERSIP